MTYLVIIEQKKNHQRLQNNESFLRNAFYEIEISIEYSVLGDNPNLSYKKRKHCRSSFFVGFRLSNSLEHFLLNVRC